LIECKQLPGIKIGAAITESCISFIYVLKSSLNHGIDP